MKGVYIPKHSSLIYMPTSREHEDIVYLVLYEASGHPRCCSLVLIVYDDNLTGLVTLRARVKGKNLLSWEI